MSQTLTVTELGPFGENLDVLPWAALTDTTVRVPNDGRTIIFARSKSSSGQTVTPASVVGPNGRTASKVITLAAGNTDPQVGCMGMLPRHLWNQPGGYVELTASVTADMEMCAVRYRTT